MINIPTTKTIRIQIFIFFTPFVKNELKWERVPKRPQLSHDSATTVPNERRQKHIKLYLLDIAFALINEKGKGGKDRITLSTRPIKVTWPFLSHHPMKNGESG